MSLAESIAYSLGGRKSGKGFRVPTVCHGGDGFNLLLTDAADGQLLATCFSHGCCYKQIMDALESQGLKPRKEFNSKQRQVYVQKKNKRQLQNALFIESHILMQYLSDRSGDVVKASDPNYLKSHPEFAPMPEESFERELEAARRTKTLIGQLYDV